MSDTDTPTHAELMLAQLGKQEIADRHAKHIAQSLFRIRDVEFVCGDCAIELEQGMEQIIRELQAENERLKSIVDSLTKEK
jgi:hypothetical protein